MIRCLFMLCLAFPVSAADVVTDVVTGQHYVFKDSPNHLPWLTWSKLPRDAWISVDATDYGVPVDAVAVFVQGVMAITHGLTPQICGETVSFRAPDQAQIVVSGLYKAPTNYVWQAGSYFAGDLNNGGDGDRNPVSTVVPLVDGKFEFGWHAQGAQDYPAGCYSGGSFVITGYLR